MNIDPLLNYLDKDIFPNDLSELIDNLIYDYTMMYFRLNKIGEATTKGDSEEYLFYLKGLRDVLRKCEPT